MLRWRRGLLAACVWMLGVALPCLAQNPTGPRTLENLFNSGEAQETPAVEAEKADSGPKRPSGTVARPKNGVQHPDLDKAWAEYDAVVAKAAEGIKAAITKQFDAATSKGDLDAAEKWQAALEKFEKAGELPAETETKAAVSGAASDYKKAREELTDAYEAVVKTLTMEKKIAEAKAVRQENQSLCKATEVQTSPVIAAFIGSWRHPNGGLEEMGANGDYVVNGDLKNPWSGKWVLDLDDPRGPCVVRHANNGTKTRWYVDPANRKRLWSGDGGGPMKRE